MKRLVLIVGCALCACGGGGGSGSGGGSWLKVEPASMHMELYQGDPTEFAITATQVGDVDPGDGALYIGIVESTDVLEPGYEVVAVDNADYLANLHLRADLEPGTHVGTFELRICHDPDILTCARPWPGSPWVIPFTFTIHQGLDLRPLDPLPEGRPWATFGGDAAHTGYVPAPALQEAGFDRRWGWNSGGTVTGVATDGGRVFVVVAKQASLTQTSHRLFAIRESDGGVDWSTDVGGGYAVSAPAVLDGKVYVTWGTGTVGFLLGYDQATGEKVVSVGDAAYGGKWGAPTPYGSTLYSMTGGIAGVMSWDTIGETPNWWARSDAGGENPWSPAADGAYVYGEMGQGISVWSADDGEWRWVADSNAPGDTTSLIFWSGTGAVVLDGGGLAYYAYIAGQNGDTFARGRLACYQVGTDTPSHLWGLTGRFRSAPVLAGDTLYVINGDALEARSPVDGAVQWSWSPQGGLGASSNQERFLAVVGDKAVVDGGWYTFIVDLASRQIDYTYPAAGPIAVSENGVAYISGRNGALIAINLR